MISKIKALFNVSNEVVTADLKALQVKDWNVEQYVMISTRYNVATLILQQMKVH